MVKTPAERLERHAKHARQGYARIRRDAAAREETLAWLDAHPSPRADVDALWRQALVGEGALSLWLESEDASWTHPDLPLRTVLASHPFRRLTVWSIRAESPGS